MEVTSSRLGVAIFGVGRMGVIHLEDIITNPALELRWIVEADINRANELAVRYNISKNVGVVTLDEESKALNDPHVEFVMICTPATTHESIVRAALTAEKAVFCEKPLAPSIEAVQSCYKLAAQVNRPLFCAFNRRFDPQVRELKRRVEQDGVGTLRVIKSVHRSQPGRITAEFITSSGGIFVDMAIHDLDLLCWIAGEEPRTIYATGHATNDLYKECKDFDSCVIVVHFPSGVVGMIEASREAPVGYFQHVEALGSKGMIHSDNHRHLNLVTHTLEGVRSEPIVQDCIERYRDSYRLELEHFINVVKGIENLEVTEDTVLRASSLADKCLQSVRMESVIKYL